jgi:hypothetical protein
MKHFLGVAASAALVLLAAFLPWGTVEATVRGRYGADPAPPVRVGVPVDAWNGHVSYCGIPVENRVVVVAAAGAAVTSWLRASVGRNVPPWIPLLLALGGLVHALIFLALLIDPRAGTIGLGSVLTAGAFSLMGVVLLRQFRAPR